MQSIIWKGFIWKVFLLINNNIYGKKKENLKKRMEVWSGNDAQIYKKM